MVKLRLVLADPEGNIIATVDDQPYPSSGATLKFTTEDIASGYAALLLNGEPTGAELAVDVNGRVEYSVQLILNSAVEEDGQGFTPGLRILDDIFDAIVSVLNKLPQ